MTKHLFNGVLNDLTYQQCCALVSCSLFQENAGSEMPKLTEELSEPLRIMQVTQPSLIHSPCWFTKSLISICLSNNIQIVRHCINHTLTDLQTSGIKRLCNVYATQIYPVLFSCLSIITYYYCIRITVLNYHLFLHVMYRYKTCTCRFPFSVSNILHYQQCLELF